MYMYRHIYKYYIYTHKYLCTYVGLLGDLRGNLVISQSRDGSLSLSVCT